MSFEKVTISAQVDAPPETVWTAWTTPDHITRWNFASDDWCCPSASVDLRPGGAYRSRMEAKEGSFGFDFTATYQEVVPQEKASFLMDDGRLAETTFTPVDGGTQVVTVFDAETEHSVEMQREGWQAILNNFKAHAESL
ncbi:MAG: SRPBCC family protein [Sagittula sp.]|uniref:SRPBCC family protein n=1 Tax=Sagittula sp. TaxID=2038081 RepID=UPI004058DAC8